MKKTVRNLNSLRWEIISSCKRMSNTVWWLKRWCGTSSRRQQNWKWVPEGVCTLSAILLHMQSYHLGQGWPQMLHWNSLWAVLKEIWGDFRNRCGCHWMSSLCSDTVVQSPTCHLTCSTSPAGGAMFHKTHKPKGSTCCIHKRCAVLLTSIGSFFRLWDVQIRTMTFFLTVINIIWTLPKPIEKC